MTLIMIIIYQSDIEIVLFTYQRNDQTINQEETVLENKAISRLDHPSSPACFRVSYLMLIKVNFSGFIKEQVGLGLGLVKLEI